MILEVKNVSYYYKSQRDKLILDHVSYGFECGKLYAILGPSGSGKTTLLSLLAGLDVPIQGEICYDGKPITTKDLAEHRRHHISLVFQSYNLIDYLTPLENVKLGGKGDPKALLGSMGIGEEYWNRSVLQLSGGQQQRVAIARALTSDAKVLLADEPTGNLDEATAWDVIDLLKHIAHEETVCLLSKLNAKQHIEVDIHMDELDLTDAEKKATYSEIKEYVLEHTGLKVSSLYIAQVKQKCGIIERENYNKPKSDDAKQPQCPPDKEKAIKEALKHFGMI